MPIQTPGDPVYRLDPDRVFPLTVLLADSELAPVDLARKCGFANVHKGIRRLKAIAAGELDHYESLRLALAAALDVGVEEMDAAAVDTRYVQWARRDRAYRQGFEPHVIWKTTLTVPSPITIAGLVIASRGLKYLPSTKHALRISGEAVTNCPDGVACYGRVIGFYVNYSPDHAVEFSREGEALTVLDRAVRPGYTISSINSRPFKLAELCEE